MKTLIFDIETVGEKFESMDAMTREALTAWVDRYRHDDEARAHERERVREELGLSPWTGQIASIAALDADEDRGSVWFQAPGSDLEAFEERGFKFVPMTERDMLETFWKVLTQKGYEAVAGFNTRGFDIPFVNVRTVVNGLNVPMDLMDGRYLYQQKRMKHIDLLDQFSHYGAVRRPNLHLVCRALGIRSPKADGVTGADIGDLFDAGDYLKIARYNMTDTLMTREVYRIWKQRYHPRPL